MILHWQSAGYVTALFNQSGSFVATGNSFVKRATIVVAAYWSDRLSQRTASSVDQSCIFDGGDCVFP